MVVTNSSKPLLSGDAKATVYDGSGSDTADAAGSSTRDPTTEPEKPGIFPIEPFKSVPSLDGAMPRQVRKVQCLSHLVLLVGVIVMGGLAIETMVSSICLGCETPFCMGRIVPLVFVMFSFMYFVRTLGQFDEQLLQKQQDIEKARQELSQRYHETTRELDNYVAKSMDAQAALAERNFDDKRKDFQRCCQKVSKDTPPAAASAVGEFLRFVKMWLSVFQECSIDPVHQPLKIVSDQELDGCSSVPEVAELTSTRLRNTKVSFISGQLEKDRDEISSLKKVWNSLTQSHEEAKEKKKRQTIRVAPQLGDMEAGKNDGGRGWFHVSGGSLCGLDTSNAEESGFPVELHCCHARCVLLSPEHLQLFAAIPTGITVIFLKIFAVDLVEPHTWPVVVAVVVALLCVCFVLYEFVDLDVVQQLEGQLKDVLAEKERLEAKRCAMMEFYGKAQQLADVWLHRTQPRLEILKRFSEEIEDASPNNFAALLSEMNGGMEALEQNVPSLSLWLDGGMDMQVMKRLGEAMAAVAYSPTLKDNLAAIPKCSKALALEGKSLQSRATPSTDGEKNSK